MKILITGGAGFIGSHLCDALLAQGHAVVAVDDLSLGREDNIAHLANNPAFAFWHQDMLDLDRLRSRCAPEGFEAVFHMAANSDIAVSHDDPGVDLRKTFQTTCAALALMRELGIKNIVFASTSAVYGEAKGLLSENLGPLLPVSHYGACKLASEAIISSYAANYGLKAWILRFPNVVGERATHGAIFDFIRKLRARPTELEVLGNGEQIKPYLYVKDLVEAMLYVWSRADDAVNLFNIGVESRTAVKDIARMVIEEMQLPATIRYTGGERGWIGDVAAFEYDLSRIHALGWHARTTSDQAVRHSIRHILGKGD